MTLEAENEFIDPLFHKFLKWIGDSLNKGWVRAISELQFSEG